MSASDGIQKYAYLIVIAAALERVSHIRIKPAGTGAVIEFWRGDVWEEGSMTDRSQPLHMHLVRKFATLLGGGVPPADSALTGRFSLARPDKPMLFVLGAVVNAFDLSVHLEIVDETTYNSARAPEPPRGLTM